MLIVKSNEISDTPRFDFKLEVPSMIFRDNHGTVLIIELISGYVDDESIPFKPRMGLVFFLAAYVFKMIAFIFFKILCKQQCCVTASPTRKVSESNYKNFRITLHNCGAKTSGKLYQFVFITIDHDRGEIFVSREHPIDLDNVLDNLSSLYLQNDCITRARKSACENKPAIQARRLLMRLFCGG